MAIARSAGPSDTSSRELVDGLALASTSILIALAVQCLKLLRRRAQPVPSDRAHSHVEYF